MQVKPVKKVVITTMIAQQIQDMVQSGKLQPGDKLPSEREMCESFDASRTAVREAISGLISKGILERRNKGIYVCKVGREVMMESIELLIATRGISIKDILEARAILEIENAGLAALRATEEDIKELEKCVIKIEDASNHPKEIRKSAAKFHELIAKSTHNPLLLDFFMVMFETFNNDPRSVNTIFKSASSHRHILEAIRSRDEDRARKEMRKHLDIVKESF